MVCIAGVAFATLFINFANPFPTDSYDASISNKELNVRQISTEYPKDQIADIQHTWASLPETSKIETSVTDPSEGDFDTSNLFQGQKILDTATLIKPDYDDNDSTIDSSVYNAQNGEILRRDGAMCSPKRIHSSNHNSRPVEKSSSRKIPQAAIVPTRNPCSGEKPRWVTCGGEMVGDSAITPDQVQNCKEGQSLCWLTNFAWNYFIEAL